MGRVTLGADTLKWNGTLFSSGWRDMQTDTSLFGTGPSPSDLSLCAYMNYNVKPYVVGTVTTADPVFQNYSINTYVKNKGYAMYFSLVNTTNNSIRADLSPTNPTYTSPGFPSITSASWPGSGATGVINVFNQTITSTNNVIRVRSTPSPGYNFTAWYTAPSGGSVITSSTDYLAYYNYSSVISNNIWYARNEVATSYWSMTVGKGTNASLACYGPTNTGYTIWFSGTGTQAEFNTHAGPVFSNSSGTYQPTSYLHFVSKVRYWNNSTKVFGSQAFCPGV